MCCCNLGTLRGQFALPNHSSSYRPLTRTEIASLNLLQRLNCMLKKNKRLGLLPRFLEELMAGVAGMLQARLPRRQGCLRETNKLPGILLVQQNRTYSNE